MRINIRIAMNHKGHKLEGRVVYLHKSELRVTMDAPHKGISGSRHLFFKNDGDGFEKDGELTIEGKKAAGTLLVNIYGYSLYFENNRPELQKHYSSIAERLNDAFVKFKKSVPAYDDQNHEMISRHQNDLQNILWLNHELYKIVTEGHDELRDIGMDTFIDLVNLYFRKNHQL